MEKKINSSSLWNTSRRGTLIIGFYRSGTHFLHDVIADRYPYSIKTFGEICNDGSINELMELTENQQGYKVCILNACVPKFYLTGDQELLSKWHVINLTRRDKVKHFLSYWFWKCNSPEEILSGLGKFKHHNTDYEIYKQSISVNKPLVPIEEVIQWLQEQLINKFINVDYTIDYDKLSTFSTNLIEWKPNQYNSIDLGDVIENGNEIKNFLSNFYLG